MAKTRLLGSLLLVFVALSAPAADRERVDLIPDKRSSWTVTRLFAPITGLFMGGPGYWYGERTIAIDTHPPGASLDLFYVRENIQLRFERARAPILIQLPRRVDAASHDSIQIRAALDGYLHQEVQIEARTREVERLIELESLPNRIEAITHTFLSNRGSLRFITREVARFRIHETPDGFSIALTKTSHSSDGVRSILDTTSENIQSLRAEPLGEDFVVRVQLNPRAIDQLDLRSTQDFDAARGLHYFSVELVPAEGNAAVSTRVNDALNRVKPEHVSTCALEFDRELREQLDPEALSRALTHASNFMTPYLRQNLQRLGELSPDGVVAFVDGSRARLSTPLDLAAASARSSEVIGLLALLRAFVGELEAPELRRGALHGVLAPELDRDQFKSILDNAENFERACASRS